MTLKSCDVKAILNAHVAYRGNVAEASKRLPYSHNTIRKVWVEHGLQLNLPGMRFDGKFSHALDEDEIRIIVQSYEKYQGNAGAAEKHLGYHASTIRKYWRLNSLEPADGRHKGNGKGDSLEGKLRE